LGQGLISGSAGRLAQQAVLAVIADVQRVVEQAQHVDVADQERQLDDGR
jgi:hypothetical protein